MRRHEVLLSGFGGQGLVLAGIILGEAIALHDGRYATHTQSYGPESRGGASKSVVIADDRVISYPEIQHPDVFLAMTQEAVNRYARDLGEEATIILDSELVTDDTPVRSCSRKVYRIPLTRIAREVGNEITANVVALGVLTAITPLVTREAIEKAILDHVPARFKEMNLRAFHRGFRAGEEALAKSNIETTRG